MCKAIAYKVRTFGLLIKCQTFCEKATPVHCENVNEHIITSHHIETTDAGLDGLCIREITVYHTTL